MLGPPRAMGSAGPTAAGDVLLSVSHLARRFGRQPALLDVSFVIRRGEVVGLIGPNGSGKTTLLECLVGLQPIDGGHVGRPGNARVTNTAFYVPDDVLPYADLYTLHVLEHVRRLYSASPAQLTRLIGQLGLQPALATRVRALSRGNRRRLLLALGLLTPHPLLLLDEPFNGLDLYQTRAMMGLLRTLPGQGRTLLLSIHQLSEAERMCQRFLLLSAGQLVGDGTLTELRMRTGLVGGSLEDVFLALTPGEASVCV
jgi:ABC-2 type transport system ATP-binding protein